MTTVRRPRSRSSPARAYRRSPGLVLYWAGSSLACFDCTSGRRLVVSPEVIALLDDLDDWTTVAELERTVSARGLAIDLPRMLRRMTALDLVHVEDHGPWPWSPWMPEAAFFHVGTRVARYTRDPLEQNRGLQAKARVIPPPPPTKAIPGRRVALPDARPLGALTETLLARRTWRNFAGDAVPLAAMATLLKMTWGVQRWARVEGQGRVALKTSPSGGARHSIEAYVLAPNVDGLSRSIYHYDAAAHALVDRRVPLSSAQVVRLLANQYHFGGAGAFVVMSAVFARSMWKYPSSRAYRAVLIEAGHLGQTFCLVATALGLAPFCTMAFSDEALERAIGVDGVGECALYIVGVGTRSTKDLARPGRIGRR